MVMQNDESTRLLGFATGQKKSYNHGVNQKTVEYSYNFVKKHLKGENVLELGPAEGVMTEFLIKDAKNLTAVEGSEQLAADLRNKYPDLEVITSLFEDFRPTKKYDFIVLGHVLEHVANPVEILSLVQTWLSDDGLVFGAVPNSNSVHRQAAVLMGLLETQKTMSELDYEYGHRRVYDLKEFEKDFTDAGLKVVEKGGYWMKPISNRQMEECWSEEMIDAFMLLGESYPEIAAEIYIVAGK